MIKKLSASLFGVLSAVLLMYVFAPPLLGNAALGAVNALMSFGMPPELAKYITASMVDVNSSGNLVLKTASGKYVAVDNGDVALSTSGGTLSLQEATSAAKCMGSGTHNGTTAVTVSTTCATTGSRVFITNTSDPTGATAAECWVTNLVAGTSFDVDCDQADDSTFNWVVLHEAP